MSSFTPLRPLLRAANSSPSSLLTRSAQRSSPFSTTASNRFSRLTLIGRLGAEPELKTTEGGREMLRYPVATDFGKGENKQTSWFQVAHFLPENAGGRKEFMLGLQRGTQVLVEADAFMKTYEDGEGKKQVLNIHQRSIEVLRRPFNADQQRQ